MKFIDCTEDAYNEIKKWQIEIKFHIKNNFL